jgi:hypothetical protein
MLEIQPSHDGKVHGQQPTGDPVRGHMYRMQQSMDSRHLLEKAAVIGQKICLATKSARSVAPLPLSAAAVGWMVML